MLYIFLFLHCGAAQIYPSQQMGSTISTLWGREKHGKLQLARGPSFWSNFSATLASTDGFCGHAGASYVGFIPQGSARTGDYGWAGVVGAVLDLIVKGHFFNCIKLFLVIRKLDNQ